MHDRYIGFPCGDGAGGHSDRGKDLVRPDMEERSFYYGKFYVIAPGVTIRYVPEAIVCGNDMIAKRLTESLRKIGVRMRRMCTDLFGFDDEDRMLYPFFLNRSCRYEVAAPYGA